MAQDYGVWAHRKTHIKVRQLLVPLPRGRLLDIAAGQGALSATAKEMGFDVAACDFLPENFMPPDMVCDQCDLDEGLPYDDASFDVAVGIEVIEHLKDRYAFATECARIVKPGGTLILTTPNVLNLASRLKFFLAGFSSLFDSPPNEFNPNPISQHIAPTPYYLLRHALVLAGFRVRLVTTDRWRRGALLLAGLYPAVRLASRHSTRRENHPEQRQANHEMLRTMRSASILFGRTLIVEATLTVRKGSGAREDA